MSATTAEAFDLAVPLGRIDLAKPTARVSSSGRKPRAAGGVLSTSGRIGVRTYWARIICGMLLAGLAIGASMLGVKLAGGSEETMGLTMGVVVVCTLVPLMVLSMFWMIQRAHDVGLHGALVLLNFVPVIGIVSSLYFGFAPGKAGENAYGATRELSPAEKFLGTAGLVVVVGYLLLAAWAGFLTGFEEG